MTIRGRFRTTDSLLGRCVHVDECAGDAAPLLPEALYAALGGSPRLDELPHMGPLRERTWQRALEPWESAS